MMTRKLKIFCFFICLSYALEVQSKETKLEEKNSTNIESNSILEEDEAVMIPTEMNWNLDNLYSWHMNNAEQNRTGCSGSDINPTFTDKEYTERLSNLPTVIELPYNKIVRSFIDYYLEKRRDQVEKMLGLSTYYFPIFEEALDANNMPLELRFLPVIESSLNPLAFSKAGASGLWQFMYSTGKYYGLTVNSLIDERRDPIKSTQAGVKYLKDLYNIYNDWGLAIAAYNCGPGNVNKAIRRSGGKRDYWQIYYYLPRETRGYLPAFIAANYFMTYYSLHNLCPLKVDVPLYTDTIVVNEKLHLQQVSTVLEIPIEELRMINPQYKRDIIPGNVSPYALCLPLNYSNDFIENKDSIFAYKADELINNMREEVSPSGSNYYQASSGNKIYYKVKSGDYLGKIATKYNVSVASLKRWNNLNSNSLQIGQQLIVYTTNSSYSSASSGNSSIYKVKSGDNLWSIAQKYPGISSTEIAKANQLNSQVLKIGQVLKIPQK